ncbi:MAG: nicotinate-nucleotide diphosphorylase (carboxylating), partial [Ignavibacteriaceae bacterium]|nr:nicotinate-nucleotide diphosphorylase (carboxylating) [Ignavibacteriaceae bacterium]
VEEICYTKAKILDTRKTVPGLRSLDKEAVRLGGGKNHRIGLSDMFLIKDNHIEIAGSITKAVESCRKFQQKKDSNLKIEVETKNLDEVKEALICNADIIMLDNFTIDLTKAETGVDFISIGALTHSVKALDISLEVELKK